MKSIIKTSQAHDSGLSIFIKSRQEVTGEKLGRMLTEVYRVRNQMMQEASEEVKRAIEGFKLLAEGEARES